MCWFVCHGVSFTQRCGDRQEENTNIVGRGDSPEGESGEWQRDSNPLLSVLKTDALPMSYACMHSQVDESL